MDFVQGAVTTLHALDGRPSPSVDRPFAAIVPMTEREFERASAEAVVRAALDAGATRVVVPIRVPAATANAMAAWLARIDPAVEVIWCNAPTVRSLVTDLDVVPRGKGGDVWLALGPATRDVDHVCLFDADVADVDASSFERLVGPLSGEAAFAKAYYARVEDDRLYGRLFRLLYRPLVRAMLERTADPFLRYLDDFRYALAGEFAVDAEVARAWSVPVGMGLEVATLGQAYATAGPRRSVQVDLGLHRHDHRAVTGAGGLVEIAPPVVAALERIVDRRADSAVSFPSPDDYHAEASAMLDRYRRDARFNGLTYDREAERRQVDRYAAAVADPERTPWLPPWSDASLDPMTVLDASEAALRVAAGSSGNT